jgi:hypothetical protein
LKIWFILPHPSITSLSHFEGIYLINFLSIHLLQCSHGNECTWYAWCQLWCFCIHGKETTLLFMWFENIYTVFPLPHFRHPKVGLKLPSQRIGS